MAKRFAFYGSRKSNEDVFYSSGCVSVCDHLPLCYELSSELEPAQIYVSVWKKCINHKQRYSLYG